MNGGISGNSYDFYTDPRRGNGSGIQMRPANSLSGGLIMPRSSGTIQTTPDPELTGWLNRVLAPVGQNPYYPAPPATHPPFRNMGLPTASANHTHAPGLSVEARLAAQREQRINELRENINRCKTALRTQDPSEIFEFDQELNTWPRGQRPW